MVGLCESPDPLQRLILESPSAKLDKSGVGAIAPFGNRIGCRSRAIGAAVGGPVSEKTMSTEHRTAVSAARTVE